ncbi:alpha-2-macroglobulin [Sphingomonas gilva]|uniref:Alpha-2-macroglobulin n=1 Tax=Sphingomonas gilva TaxID=2305907 RepID=A0A396RMY9_9SPHN|nr:alpha-2-macroglobulin [Sphingomonas gilva]
MALILAGLAPLVASADSRPQVTMATPGIADGAIERFTARFSEAMAPLGDPRAQGPFDVQCAVTGEGRWADQQTYVHEFADPLPGGTTCTFTLREGLRSQRGVDVTGQQRFTVDSGGPTARAVMPARYDGEIEEDQVFLVAANLSPDRASVAANAYCAVDGIGEKIAVDVLGAEVPGRLLAALGPDRWQVQNFLSEAGLPTALPENETQRARALASVTALKCRRPLPPGRDVALVWSGQITGGGRTAGADQRFDFKVRQPFTARFECGRVNPQAGCNPVQDAWVRFTAPIPTAEAEAIRLTVGERQIAPTLTDEDKRKATQSEVKFAAPLPANVGALLSLPAGIKDESGRALANAERFPLAVKIDEAPPLVKFAAPFGILEASEGGVLPVTVRNVEPALQGRNLALGGETLRVEGADGEIAKWMRDIEKANRSDYRTEKRGGEDVTVNYTGATPLLGAARGEAIKLGLPGKGKDFEVVGIPLAKSGFYVVELASPRLGQALLGRKATRYVTAGALVTNLSVHFKWGRDVSMAWVTSLDGAQPVAGAEIRITDSCTGRTLARGQSDSRGRATVRGLPQPETYGTCEGENPNAPLMVSARKGGDFSFTMTGWGEGIRPYDFDLPYGWDERPEIFHTVFDRALVRQGETVNMKHLYRRPVATGFSSEGLSGTLRLAHRGSGTQFELPLKIGADGIGETTWTAPAGAPQGDYDLSIEAGERTIWPNQSFRIDEYRLPTMRASVTGPKDAQVRPKSVPVDLYVGYLAGGAASNLPVSVRTAWFEATARPENYERFTFGGKAVEEGVKPLDGDGEEALVPLPPTQTLPLSLNAQGTARQAISVPQAIDTRTDMLVEMDYEDANGEVLTASRRITLYPAAVQLGIRTDGWMMRDDDLRLQLVALDTAGMPVRGQRIEVALYSREILTARRRLIGGFYAYDNRMRTTRIDADCSATTDAQGLASCTLDPGVSGEVYAVATTRDADGNVARAATSVWLAGEDEWWFGGDNGDRMDLIPEQPAYKAGETARFQVRMPFRQATALVTIEREGVLGSFVTTLDGSDPVIEVPMPASYAPDVYVSVLAVRGRVEQGWWDWFKELFGAREHAPRPTALVDLAKPAYRLGIAKVKVGWEGHKLGVEVRANKEKFSARDTATVDVAVKRPDGAAARSAEIAFAAVDEALLQLAPNDSWDVLAAMMGERPLSVLTATAQTQVVGKRHYGRKAVEAGGGGGDASALNRENFQPVLLWRGRVPLDANGHARLQVPLSDSLSSFKLVAIATDGAGLFGTGEATVRTAQDLSLYAGIPPLVRTGDWFAAGFTLRNGSDRPMTVTAEVAVIPRVAQGRPLTVTIPAGGAAPIAWNLTAPAGLDRLQWQVSARSADGRAADRITVSQEVAPAVPIETWAAVLTRIGDTTSIPIAPPAGALPGGFVTVSLADTLAPSLDGVRAYMGDYPYQCFEQRTSRAVALGDTAAWNALAGEIPAYQDGDGLLRYFPSESLQGSDTLTAYVMSITAEAGLAMPPASRTRMIEALTAVVEGRIRRERYGGDDRLVKLAALAALARNGAASPAMLGQIGLPVGEMPTGALADWLTVLDRTPGIANAAAQKAEAERILRTRITYEGTRLDLSDGADAPWWMMTSDDEMAIRATLAALGRPGWQDEAPRMMAGVGLRQRRGHWDTTPANAWGAVAARKFGQLYPATAIAGTTTARIGGRSVSRAWPLAVDQRFLRLPLPASSAPLALNQSGGAGPWATVSVRAAVPLTRPLSAGYRMSRKVDVVQARQPGRLGRGDVVRVTITVEAGTDRNWVVISDPIPPGATVLGNLGGQSEILQAGGESEGMQPSYTERGRDAWRAYFEWLPRGRATVSYTMRLNGAGDFGLPPSRVEAMYSPEIRAALPNRRLRVAQR